MTVFLFYTGTNGFQGIADSKYSAFLVLCGGYSLVMLLLGAELALIGNLKVPSLKTIIYKSSWTQRFVIVYLLITWLSAVVSPYFPITIIGATRNEGALTITIYCITFLLLSVYGFIKRWMLPTLAVTVSLFDILCIFQLFGFNPFTLYPKGDNYFGANVDYGGAYLGTIGNVDLVAAFFCIVIPILWVSIIRCKHKMKWLLLIPLGLSIFVLVKMWVLAGLVGVFVGGLISLCVVLPLSTRAKKILWCMLAGTIVLAILCLFLFDPGHGMFHEIHMILHGELDASFGSGRIHIWRSVLECIPKQFLFGSGPDTMHLAHLEPFYRYDETMNTTIVAEIDVAHNDYLNILFHQGIFAALAYIAMLVYTAKQWVYKPAHSIKIAILGSALLGYSIQAFFGFSMCMVSPFFWLILALFEGAIRNLGDGGS